MLVRCERDRTLFSQEPIPRPHWTEEGVDKDTFTINCPTCGRVYVKKQDGTWESDRKLTVFFQNVEKPTRDEVRFLLQESKDVPARAVIGSPKKLYIEWAAKAALTF
jgi:hypothetical protein